MPAITIEILTKNTNGRIADTISVTAQDNESYTTRQIKLAELWPIEISCENAGYTPKIVEDQIIGDSAIYTKIVWSKQ